MNTALGESMTLTQKTTKLMKLWWVIFRRFVLETVRKDNEVLSMHFFFTLQIQHFSGQGTDK